MDVREMGQEYNKKQGGAMSEKKQVDVAAVRAAVAKHGGMRPASRALGIAYRQVRNALGVKDPEPVVVKPANSGAWGRRISEKELLIETDAETRFVTNLSVLLRGIKRGEYMRDYDVRREIGASGDASLWREVRKSPQFSKHILEIGNGSDPALYWGHSESVATMIERGKAHRPSWAK
jgi:hypothetical protein